MRGCVAFLYCMDLNQRAMAARQFLMNQVKKSPLVQAVQQKSLKPYRGALNNALQPANLLPMGRLRTVKPIDPKILARGAAEFEEDAARFRADRHFESARKTAERIKKFHAEEQARKTKEMMVRAFSGFIQRSKNMSNFQNGL